MSIAPDLNSLHSVVNAMENQAVLAIGDIMLDRYVYGDANRISPESPVPVLAIRHENQMLGGVGNVLTNLHGLGVSPHVLAIVGADAAAAEVRRLATEHGADAAGLLAAPGRPTTIKTRFLAMHQQLLRADYESNAAVPEDVADALIAAVTALLPRAGAVVLSDYGKGVLTSALIAAVIGAAHAAGVPVLVDPKGSDYSIYRGASVVTPNRKELAEATGMKTLTDADVTAAARHLIDTCGIGAVVATRSQDGMTILQAGAEPLHLRTEAQEVFDVSGAGDTVIATLAASLAAGADLQKAALVANIAAGLVVAKVGTAPVRRAELLAALDRRDLGITPRPKGHGGGSIADTAREAPVLTLDEAAEMVQRWKARGLRVGFTNGCFDILHQGHVSYLNRARDACDRLIVGLNADASVRRLKGADRPLHDQESRAIVMGALGAVDAVLLFGDDLAEDDKPLRLIERLRPDIHFKAGDYTEGQLPEAPLVRSYGGVVAIMPFVEGHSTTKTLGRIRDRE